jgi:hypothetical protein
MLIILTIIFFMWLCAIILGTPIWLYITFIVMAILTKLGFA